MSEPTWTFDSKIRKLDTRLTEETQNMNETLQRTLTSVTSAVETIRADVQKDVEARISSVSALSDTIQKHIQRCEMKIADCIRHVDTVHYSLEEELTKHEQALNQREIILNNTIEALRTKINRMHFNIIDNEDNVSFTYTNPDGFMEYGAVRKFSPDEETITSINKKIALKYKFDTKNFSIKNDVISVTALKLNTGKQITADRIHNDLSNATYNIESLTKKVSNIVEKLYTFNGFLAANNFKKATPTEDQLYNFAISCLSTKDNTITKEQVPSATKIKNTFDNHIWVLNRVTVDGLTTSKWADFGSDSVCVASNDGVHGLVTGSQERYMGYVDLQGRISINGLEEDLTDIFKSIQNINADLTRIQSEFSAKLNDIQERLSKLEA